MLDNTIEIDEKSLDYLLFDAKDYCLVNVGLCTDTAKSSLKKAQIKSFIKDIYLKFEDILKSSGLVMFDGLSSTNHNQVRCLPITLTPRSFPNSDFSFVINIQNSINLLVHRIANDANFLKQSLTSVIEVDDFTKRLWKIYETVNSEGIKQPISFGIIRSDYMLDANKMTPENLTCLSQVEINTIASSFGCATTKLAELHEYILKKTNNLDFLQRQPKNDNLNILAQGIAKAWKLYNDENAIIAFVVNENEKNIGDQRLLEYGVLAHEPKARIHRLTLSTIHLNGYLNNENKLFYNNTEIAVVYYRAGYDPNDYPTENEWQSRLLIERSKSIKCPTINYHLAGCKKIQQVLCEPNVIEKFLSPNEAKLIRSTFVDQYSFDNRDEVNLFELIEMAKENCEDFVLKPQREGGGHNIYGSDIREFFNKLTDRTELMGYILMKLIKPVLSKNLILRPDANNVVEEDILSEIGIYGVIIGDNQQRIIHNVTGGYLLRSKSPSVNEGGIAAGFSVLDSIYLA